MAVKAPPPELIPDWQYTLDEDARFYSWTGTRGFPAAPASWKVWLGREVMRRVLSQPNSA
jgi:hypothetical protein